MGHLKITSLRLQYIKLDKKKAEAFPERLEDLKWYSRSTNFMIQLFKKSLIADCNCKACNDCHFKVVRMPPLVYQQV